MEYNVKRLPHGYLVSDKDYEPIAGFSNFEDLAFWLNDKFRIEPYTTPELECVDADAPWDKAPDGWIEWKGGEPPAIANGTPIIVRHRDLSEHETTMIGPYNFRWNHRDHESDIVAYRVVTPVPVIARSYSNDSGHGEPMWIDWKGGECPVSGDTIVQVKLHSAKSPEKPSRADRWSWSMTGPIHRIIAYKVCD